MDKETRKYYAAYEERYKTAHEHGVSWSSDRPSPIVLDVLRRYGLRVDRAVLEIGCGEGRDAKAVLAEGCDLTATDASPEAISYCRSKMPEYASRFRVLDCLTEDPGRRYDFIYAVAVVHMLLPDADRDGFYRFIFDHLEDGGLGLICTRGDGTFEMQTDIREAFQLRERDHESGKMMVAATSCRIVSFETFLDELTRNGLAVIERGITAALPDFDSLMYAVVQRAAGPGD